MIISIISAAPVNDECAIDLSPCTCSGWLRDPVGKRISWEIDCVGITSDAILQVFQTASSKLGAVPAGYSILHLDRVTDSVNITSDFFGRYTFSRIVIRNSSVSSLIKATSGPEGKSPTITFPLTEELVFENVTFTTKAMTHGNDVYHFASLFPNLKSFVVKSSNLNSLPTNAFIDCSSKLELISLAGNQISAIGERIFFNLPSLSFVDLSHNHIGRIGEYAFAFGGDSGCSNLLQILLYANDLKGESFDYSSLVISRPATLHLGGNNITFLRKEVFHPLMSTSFVTIILGDSNPISCSDCRNSWLREFKGRMKGTGAQMYSLVDEDDGTVRKVFKTLRAEDPKVEETIDNVSSNLPKEGDLPTMRDDIKCIETGKSVSFWDDELWSYCDISRKDLTTAVKYYSYFLQALGVISRAHAGHISDTADREL